MVGADIAAELDDVCQTTCRKPSALDLEILRRRLASIGNFLVLNALTLVQAGEAFSTAEM
jgi:hypothetical protein